ncbi:hypothetical protein Tco_0282482 [Tanacetum coccineum]
MLMVLDRGIGQLSEQAFGTRSGQTTGKIKLIQMIPEGKGASRAGRARNNIAQPRRIILSPRAVVAGLCCFLLLLLLQKGLLCCGSAKAAACLLPLPCLLNPLATPYDEIAAAIDKLIQKQECPAHIAKSKDSSK